MDYGVSLFCDEAPKGYKGIPWPAESVPRRQKPVSSPDTRIIEVPWDFDVACFKTLFLDFMTRVSRAE